MLWKILAEQLDRVSQVFDGKPSSFITNTPSNAEKPIASSYGHSTFLCAITKRDSK
jgi:hypothetical protein